MLIQPSLKLSGTLQPIYLLHFDSFFLDEMIAASSALIVGLNLSPLRLVICMAWQSRSDDTAKSKLLDFASLIS